jgi:hypothetical protein
MVLLGIDADHANWLAEDGTLWPAFDLSSPGSMRQKIHVFRDSLLDYHLDGKFKPTIGLDQGIDLILPALLNAKPETAIVRATELAFRFCLCAESITKLIIAGELREVGSHSSPQTPQISRASIVAFLKRRAIV